MEICNDRTVGCMRLQTKQKQQSLRVVVAVVEVLLYVHRNHRFIRDGGAQDGHLDFHTAPEL